MTKILRNGKFDSLFDTIFMDDFFFNKGLMKDMHPYDVVSDKKENKTIIAYQAVGINKKDVKISKQIENGKLYLSVEGKTYNKVLDKDFSVRGRFLINSPDTLDKIKYKVEDGVIYIHLFNKEYKDDIKIEEI